MCLEGMSAQGIPWRVEGFTDVAQVEVVSGTSECRGDGRSTFGGEVFGCEVCGVCAAGLGVLLVCARLSRGTAAAGYFPLATFSGACAIPVLSILVVLCPGRATASVAVVMAAAVSPPPILSIHISYSLSRFFTRAPTFEPGPSGVFMLPFGVTSGRRVCVRVWSSLD